MDSPETICTEMMAHYAIALDEHLAISFDGRCRHLSKRVPMARGPSDEDR
jgi:hypothetical protein